VRRHAAGQGNTAHAGRGFTGVAGLARWAAVGPGGEAGVPAGPGQKLRRGENRARRGTAAGAGHENGRARPGGASVARRSNLAPACGGTRPGGFWGRLCTDGLGECYACLPTAAGDKRGPHPDRAAPVRAAGCVCWHAPRRARVLSGEGPRRTESGSEPTAAKSRSPPRSRRPPQTHRPRARRRRGRAPRRRRPPPSRPRRGAPARGSASRPSG
jgi:hypothetical protein